MDDLKTRFWISLAFLVMVGFLLYFVNYLATQIAIAVIFTGIVILAQWEFYHMTAQKGMSAQWISYLATPCYIGATFISFFYSQWNIIPNIVLGLLIFALFLEHFFKKNSPISSIAASIMGIMYVVVPLNFLFKITFIPYNTVLGGQWWVTYLLLVTKGGDIGAYFFGKALGKHYLAPTISPKKTYEGLAGGILFSVAISFAMIYWTPHASTMFNIPWIYAVVLGVALAVIGLLGDLSESIIKRDAHVKDSNKFKGLGGVLDMFDSLIFAAPTFYLFLLLGHYI